MQKSHTLQKGRLAQCSKVPNYNLSAPVAGAVTLQLVDKDYWDVCAMRPVCRIDPHPNCRLAFALCSRMLPCSPGQAWLNMSCLARTVVGWLVPMVCCKSPGEGRTVLQTIVLPNAAAVAAVEQLGTALEAEQLMQPAAEGAA